MPSLRRSDRLKRKQAVKATLNNFVTVIPAEAGIQLNQRPRPRLSPGRRMIQRFFNLTKRVHQAHPESVEIIQIAGHHRASCKTPRRKIPDWITRPFSGDFFEAAGPNLAVTLS